MEASARRLYEQINGDEAGIYHLKVPAAYIGWPGLNGQAFKLAVMAWNWIDGKANLKWHLRRSQIAMQLGTSSSSIDRAAANLVEQGLWQKVDSKDGYEGYVAYAIYDPREVATQRRVELPDAQRRLPLVMIEEQHGPLGILEIENDTLFDDQQRTGSETGSGALSTASDALRTGSETGSGACPEEQLASLKKIQSSLAKRLSSDRRAADDEDGAPIALTLNTRTLNPIALGDEGEAAAPQEWWIEHHPDLVERWGEAGLYAVAYRDAASSEQHFLRGANSQTAKCEAQKLAMQMAAMGDRADLRARESLARRVVEAVRDGALPWSAIEECLDEAKGKGHAKFGRLISGCFRKKFFDVGRKWPPRKKKRGGQ